MKSNSDQRMKSNNELFHQVIDEKTQRSRVSAVVSDASDPGLHSMSEVPGFTEHSFRKKVSVAFAKKKPGIYAENLGTNDLRMFPDASSVFHQTISGSSINRSSYQQREISSVLESPSLRLPKSAPNASSRAESSLQKGSRAESSLQKPVSVLKAETTPHRCNLGPPSSEEEKSEEEFDMKVETPPRPQYPRLQQKDSALAVAMEVEDYYTAGQKRKPRVDLHTKGKVKLWEPAARKPR